MVIHQPYGCNWGKFLAPMTQLETFNISVLFHGCLNVNPATFGAQWAQIAGALDGQRRVQVLVQAKAIVEEVGEDRRGEDAQAFIEILKKDVYPSHLQWLSDPDAIVGSLPRFSFAAEAIIEKAACRCGRGSAHAEHP